MAKIKDWSMAHPNQSTGVVYKTYGYSYEAAEQSFTKNLERDIENYFLNLAVPEKKGAQYKKPRVAPKKTKAQLQHENDWAYDEMVDNRLTIMD